MRGAGLGSQGQQSSQSYAFKLGTICDAEIRVSMFVLLVVGYNLFRIVDGGGEMTGFLLVREVGNQILLYTTVLCHEFGHGNMARYLGGRIDHILLWVFGGICFSTRPEGNFDNTKILRDDLLIVAAGPLTHFLQAPAWGLVMWAIFVVFKDAWVQDSIWDLFCEALRPLGYAPQTPFYVSSYWGALPWIWACYAVQLNVILFLFNVFFPMYPADGSKLLTTSLMFCCGVPPRRAALILLVFAVPCACLLILNAVLSIRSSGNPLSGVMGFMGLMSLAECYNIWNLRKARRLHEHGLFRTERDSFGVVHRINQADFDDEAPLTTGGMCGALCRSMLPSRGDGEAGWSCAGCLACLFPCRFRTEARAPEVPQLAAVAVPGGAVAEPPRDADSLRGQRSEFLASMDRRRAEHQRTVREYMEERYGSGRAAGGVAPAQDPSRPPSSRGGAAV